MARDAPNLPEREMASDIKANSLEIINSANQTLVQATADGHVRVQDAQGLVRTNLHESSLQLGPLLGKDGVAVNAVELATVGLYGSAFGEILLARQVPNNAFPSSVVDIRADGGPEGVRISISGEGIRMAVNGETRLFLIAATGQIVGGVVSARELAADSIRLVFNNMELIKIDTASGKISCVDVELTNGDCAEEFDCAHGETVRPGSVVFIDSRGAVSECVADYDQRVVGVRAGGGAFKPAIVLDRRPDRRDRVPVTLMGKTCCLVDADAAPVAVGDILVSSSVRGYAKKGTDHARLPGTILGKALQPLTSGQGLLPILLTLG